MPSGRFFFSYFFFFVLFCFACWKKIIGMRVVMGNCGWWEQKCKMLIAMKLNNDIYWSKFLFKSTSGETRFWCCLCGTSFCFWNIQGSSAGVGCTAGQVFQQARRAAALDTSPSCRARSLVHMDGKFKVYNNLQAAVTPTYPFPSLPLIYAEI